MIIFIYLLIGLVAGIFGGALGLGGGSIMVPLLALGFGLTQHQAQGTALAAMLPPVFILGVMRYYYAGNVKVTMAVYLGVGLLVGALIGAHYVQGLPEAQLKKIFGIVLILIGIKMAFLK